MARVEAGPGGMAVIAAGPTRGWQIDTMDVCHDIGTFITGWFCPCFLAGTVSEFVGDGFCIGCIAALTPIRCCAGACYRTKLRNQLGIRGDDCGDMCCHCCCSPCALCQEVNEINRHRKYAPLGAMMAAAEAGPTTVVQNTFVHVQAPHQGGPGYYAPPPPPPPPGHGHGHGGYAPAPHGGGGGGGYAPAPGYAAGYAAAPPAGYAPAGVGYAAPTPAGGADPPGSPYAPADGAPKYA